MLTERPWKLEAVARLLAGLLLSWSVGLLLAASLGHFLPKKSQDLAQFFHFVLSTISFHGVALVLAHLFLKAHGLSWSEFLGLNDPRLKRAARFALVAGVFVVPAALALSHLSAAAMTALRLEPIEQISVKVLHANVAWWQRVCFGLTAIGLAPLVEEMIFRGILYPIIKQLGYPRLALFGTSLVFAAIHANLLTFLPLTFVGIALVLVYENTDNLLAPILTHAFFNTINFTILVVSDSSAGHAP